MLNGARLMAFVPIRDSQRSRPFYENVLGLRFISDDPFALVMDSNGITVRLAKTPKFTPADFTVLGWQVAAIAKTVAELEKKGVRFERFPGLPQDAQGVWTAPGGAGSRGSKTLTAIFFQCHNTFRLEGVGWGAASRMRV